MLKHRIIPILLTDGKGNCVKPIRFERPYRKVGSLMQYIKIMEKRNIDELIIIDIEATRENRLINCEKIKEYTSQLFCPLTLGGGIKSLDDINKLLKSGADKVCIDSLNTDIMWKGAEKFGKQCITASACYKENKKGYNLLYWPSRQEYMPMIIGRACEILEGYQAGEILLSSADKEGLMNGFDIDVIEIVANVCKVPIIANCGCGEPKHMKQAIAAGASAVAASSMFLYTDITPRDCAEYLKKEGVLVR